MNTRLVNTAAGVLHAAMEQGTATAAGLATALEAAQLLQSPESAAELSRLREEHREALAGAGVADELYREWMRRAETAEARVAELENDRNREVAEWLGKKACEYRSTRSREHALQAEALERMADKVRRGAIRPAAPFEDPHDSPLHHTYRVGHDLPEYPSV